VHTDREISCTQKPYSGSRIFVDFNGTVISPGSTAGKKSAVKVTSSKEKLRAVMAAASGSSRRAEKCALCTFRNFCTGLCKGKPGEALTKKDEELYCAYIANVVQELMWNIDRKKELLSFVQ
jgi:radical SAM protein with 4Fe4S-binding SPASM domain